MYSVDGSKPKRKILKWVGGVCAFLIVVAVIAGILTLRWYNTSLKPVNEGSTEVEIVLIPPGASTSEIAAELSERNLLRSSTAFEWYLRFNDKAGTLQAGTFELTQAMTVQQIVEIMSVGKNPTKNFTIIPGLRVDQIRDVFIDAGFSEADVDVALDAATYADHPINEFKPVSANLEGYLYPETFEINDSTTAQDLVERSLNEMLAVFTDEIVNAFAAQGVTPHEAVIIGSIVEKEVTSEEDKAKVAQVFLKRFREGIPLGADPTFKYASAVFGGPALPSLDNPYNTRLYGGLPPGPISNMTKSTLEAMANPADTNYLYFVSGDDGITRFNETLQGHESDAATYCIELCKL